MTGGKTGAAVLVVDDDADIREALVEALSIHGYKVAEATNGAEALSYLRTHDPPRVIILDLMMPIMDGWRFCEERGMDAVLAAIPVVVISASLNIHAPPAGAQLFLPKPVTSEALFAAVKEFY